MFCALLSLVLRPDVRYINNNVIYIYMFNEVSLTKQAYFHYGCISQCTATIACILQSQLAKFFLQPIE